MAHLDPKLSADAEPALLAFLFRKVAGHDEIGEVLNISPKTVACHRENIMSKLNLHTRTELVKYTIRKGFIQA
jgi:FixJ family two-component response regulator